VAPEAGSCDAAGVTEACGAALDSACGCHTNGMLIASSAIAVTEIATVRHLFEDAGALELTFELSVDPTLEPTSERSSM